MLQVERDELGVWYILSTSKFQHDEKKKKENTLLLRSMDMCYEKFQIISLKI